MKDARQTLSPERIDFFKQSHIRINGVDTIEPTTA